MNKFIQGFWVSSGYHMGIHKFDILCISETHLDSSVLKDGNALSIEGYSIIRADHPVIPKEEVYTSITMIRFL